MHKLEQFVDHSLEKEKQSLMSEEHMTSKNVKETRQENKPARLMHYSSK